MTTTIATNMPYDEMIIALEKSNKAFHKMSKKRQRILIAKDVLLQIKMKTYKGSAGEYVSAPVLDNLTAPELQSRLLRDMPECGVCGLGGAFLSLARLGNEVELGDDYYYALDPIFGSDQRALIEATFEGWGALNLCNEDTQGAYRHMKFYNRYPDASKRLAAIFRNIVKNDGLFKP